MSIKIGIYEVVDFQLNDVREDSIIQELDLELKKSGDNVTTTFSVDVVFTNIDKEARDHYIVVNDCYDDNEGLVVSKNDSFVFEYDIFDHSVLQGYYIQTHAYENQEKYLASQMSGTMGASLSLLEVLGVSDYFNLMSIIKEYGKDYTHGELWGKITPLLESEDKGFWITFSIDLLRELFLWKLNACNYDETYAEELESYIESKLEDIKSRMKNLTFNRLLIIREFWIKKYTRQGKKKGDK